MGLTFAITVAYDGTAYAGWQVQETAATVQGVLERAAEHINGERTPVLGSGRTDAGVHARGQVARFRTERDLAPERVPHALNAYLPEDVVVIGARTADSEFHPIRDARAKHYRYTLKVAEFDDPFDRRYVLRTSETPDMDAMARAAGHLQGRHDFSAFEKSGSPRLTTVRTLRQLDLVRRGDYIHFNFVGDGFLYGMARNLAGTLLRVGRGALDPETIPAGLDSGTSEIAGPCLPPHGLSLMGVSYEETE